MSLLIFSLLGFDRVHCSPSTVLNVTPNLALLIPFDLSLWIGRSLIENQTQCRSPVAMCSLMHTWRDSLCGTAVHRRHIRSRYGHWAQAVPIVCILDWSLSAFQAPQGSYSAGEGHSQFCNQRSAAAAHHQHSAMQDRCWPGIAVNTSSHRHTSQCCRAVLVSNC
jgi:hypothetical protein